MEYFDILPYYENFINHYQEWKMKVHPYLLPFTLRNLDIIDLLVIWTFCLLMIFWIYGLIKQILRGGKHSIREIVILKSY